MFFYTIYKSKIWKELETNRRNIRVFMAGATCYIFIYSYLNSQYMANNQQTANILKKIMYGIILLDCALGGYYIMKQSKKNKLKDNSKLHMASLLQPFYLNQPYFNDEEYIQYRDYPQYVQQQQESPYHTYPRQIVENNYNKPNKQVQTNKDSNETKPIIDEQTKQSDDLESDMTKDLFIKTNDDSELNIPVYKKGKSKDKGTDSNDSQLNNIPIYKPTDDTIPIYNK